MGAEAPLTRERPALLQNVLVLAGRGATGILPVLITVVASRTYDVAVMGQIVTAVAVAYAIGEVADGQSQRHVTRLLSSAAHANARAGTSDDVDDGRQALAAFNGLRFTLLAIALVAMLAVPFFHRPVLYVVLLTAVWGATSNMQYARALADGRFDVLGIGPFVPLVVLVVLAGLLAATGVTQGPWLLALALHGARAAEVVVLGLRVPWPGWSFDPATLRRQWIETRYLLLQTAMSAAHVRLLIPVVLFVSGAATAGIFSIGLSLLSVLSLVAVAVTIPAYRRSTAAGPSATASEMIRRTWKDLAAGVAVCGLIGLLLALGTPVLLRTVFKVDAAVGSRRRPPDCPRRRVRGADDVRRGLLSGGFPRSPVVSPERGECGIGLDISDCGVDLGRPRRWGLGVPAVEAGQRPDALGAPSKS